MNSHPGRENAAEQQSGKPALDQAGPSERILRLKDHIRALNGAGVRRTTFFQLVAQSLRDTVGQPRPIRRAKAFAHLLERARLVVLPHELLAGSIIGTWPLAEGLPGYEERRQEAIEVLQQYLAAKASGRLSAREIGSRRVPMYARVHYHGNIDYGELQRLNREMEQRFAHEDIGRAEIGRELLGHFNFDYGEETRRLFDELPWVAANHLDLNYGKLVRRGFGDVLQEIKDRLDSAEGEPQRTFYESAGIAVGAAIRFVERYAETIDAAAGRDGVSPERAAELRTMAQVCRRVARAQPRTFREAMQLVWMGHTIANLPGTSAMSFARFDQYMWPIYRKSLAEGTTTRRQARELISCMWLKVNEPHMRTVQSICLGGTTRHGHDAANPLTALCLQVCADLRMPYPNAAVRLSRHSPHWLVDQVVKTMQLGFGQPMVLNDETWIPNLHRVGFPLQDARDYYNMGCVEMMVMGRQPEGAAVHMHGWDWSAAKRRAEQTRGSRAGGPTVDFPQIVELVLNNGEQTMAGETGPRTGTEESFTTFQDFLEACRRQIEERIRRAPALAWKRDLEAKGRHYDPYASAMLEGPLENGRDMFQGGCVLPPIRRIGGHGLGTAVDSLVAIKKHVFDEGCLTLQELKAALDADFDGYERVRSLLSGATPFYGNDLDEADAIAEYIFGAYADAIHAQNDGSTPGPFVTSVFSYTRHVNMGEVTGATPDGRQAGAPFSDSIGPAQGRDTGGPTALLKSITRLNHSLITGACSVNLKFTDRMLQGSAGFDSLKSLLNTYLRLGGAQLQVNCVDEETLRDAQRHPEEHGDLVVRVAGYCEFFTSLDHALQAEIIERTAHEA